MSEDFQEEWPRVVVCQREAGSSKMGQDGCEGWGIGVRAYLWRLL